MSELNRREAIAVGAGAAVATVVPSQTSGSEGLYEQLRAEYLPHCESPDEAAECARDAAEAGMTVIRRARLAAGLTMLEVATKVSGTERGFWRYSNFENNRGEEPDFQEGMAICQLLQITPAELADAIMSRV